MKVIVNRGFDKTFTKIVVSKDGKDIRICPAGKDYCTFDATATSKVEVKLRFPGIRTVVIATIDGIGEKTDTFYISPSQLFKRWIIVNYMIFTCIFLLFFVLQKAVVSDLFDWLFTGFTSAWALSLISMSSCLYSPSMCKRMFKTESI